MTLQVTGKNIETSAAFQDYIVAKVGTVLEKYIGPEISGHVRVEKERSRFRTTCSIRLRTGMLVEAEGTGDDAYQSADAALEHLEKRVRRYKRRLTNHHHSTGDRKPAPEITVRDYVVNLSDEDEDASLESGPVIVAETELALRELSVSEAVLQLDLTDQPFLVFRNAAHGAVNVVYRRPDGHIGWIDPSAAKPVGDRAGSADTD